MIPPAGTFVIVTLVHGAEGKRAGVCVRDGACLLAQAAPNTLGPPVAWQREAVPFTLCRNGHSTQRVAAQNPGGLHAASVSLLLSVASGSCSRQTIKDGLQIHKSKRERPWKGRQKEEKRICPVLYNTSGRFFAGTIEFQKQRAGTRRDAQEFRLGEALSLGVFVWL